MNIPLSCSTFLIKPIDEAVVNAFYHRDYREHAPIVSTIEPGRITIFKLGGPDHSISMEAIRRAKSLRSRRYRNVRLGDCLKELDLTEGRATGIPTIQDELRSNGSSSASIETDDERSFFLIELPCRYDMVESMAIEEIIEKDQNKDLTERQHRILLAISGDVPLNVPLNTSALAETFGVSRKTLQRDLDVLIAKN